MINTEDLKNRFMHHPPRDAETIKAHEKVRDKCLNLAIILTELIPDGQEKALAITNLEQVMFWANAAIARRKEEERFFCMCEDPEHVARDMYSTCGKCGGIDAYGYSKNRGGMFKKTLKQDVVG